MGIEFDAAAQTSYLFGNGSTFAHTTGSGAYRHAQVGIVCGETATVSGTPTYDGVNLVAIDNILHSGGGGIRVYLYHLVDPNAGAGNVVYALSGNTTHGAFIVTRTGVDPNNPLGTAVKASGADATPTDNVTSGEGELVVDAVGFATGTSRTITVGAGQTQRANQSSGPGSSAGFGGSEEAGASSVTMSWTISAAADAWGIVAVPLKPYVSERDRLVKYFANTFDPRRRIIDNQGRDVPRSLLKTDEYFRNEGPFLITARKPASLIQEKSVGYIETVGFREGRDVSIETVTETMLESLFRRLGGSAA